MRCRRHESSPDFSDDTSTVSSGSGSDDTGDENKERGNWSSKVDFLLSLIGYAVGLGNIWRFPYRAYQNGGASFLIPYLIVLGTAGLPLFFMEMALGQFTSRGPARMWNFMPMLRGVGWGMVMVSFMVCIYYNMTIAYILRYLFASFTSTLPWSSCKEEWIPLGCYQRNGTNATGNETVSNMLVSTSTPMQLKTPSQIYWEHEVLNMSPGIGVDSHIIKWDLALCLLLGWIIIFFCIVGGVKATGKVVYVTAIVPYVVLITLLIWNAQLDGAWLGIKFYIVPVWERLTDLKVWLTAGTQIFYSLGVAFGTLPTMASYNRFNNNIYRDSVAVALINCATSVLGGFVIFSVLGFMSHETGVPVEDVATDGPGLAFVAYPEGIAMMPVAPFWSILFFVMLFTLGVDSQFAMLETVITAVIDEFPTLKKGRRKIAVVAAFCISMFFLGLPQCSLAGSYIWTLFDNYSGGLNLIVFALIEVVVLAWFYGFKSFAADIKMMIGHKPDYYWIACWLVLSPLTLLFLFVLSCIAYAPSSLADYVFPAWADGLGWLMFTLSVIMIPVFVVVEYVLARRRNPSAPVSTIFRQELLKPTDDWGPALPKHRTGRYADPKPAVDDVLQSTAVISDEVVKGTITYQIDAKYPAGYENGGVVIDADDVVMNGELTTRL